MIARVRVGDVEIVYERAGEGPPLVLLHGGFVSRRTWAEQSVALERSYDVVRVDLRGHGDSGRGEGPYDVARMAQDVCAVLDHAKLERAALWGHSLGGMIGQYLAYRRPERVCALILEDTTYNTASTLGEWAHSVMARGMFRVLPVRRVAKMSATELGARRPDLGPYIYEEMARFAGERAHFHRIWRAVFAFDASAWIHHVMCPTLVLVASDNAVTLRQGEQMEAWMARAELRVMEGSGHMIHWDRPIEVRHEVEEFLRGVPGFLA